MGGRELGRYYQWWKRSTQEVIDLADSLRGFPLRSDDDLCGWRDNDGRDEQGEPEEAPEKHPVEAGAPSRTGDESGSRYGTGSEPEEDEDFLPNTANRVALFRFDKFLIEQMLTDFYSMPDDVELVEVLAERNDLHTPDSILIKIKSSEFKELGNRFHIPVLAAGERR